MAVIQPGVVGRTRSESEDDPLKYGMAAYQAVGDLTARRRALEEQQRQFDITNFNEQVVKPAGGLALLLQTEEGKAAAEPFVAQMLQVKREQPGLLGRFIAEKAPGIAQMLGIDQGEVQSYMSSLADSPLTAEYLQRGAESAFLDGRVTQGQEAPPSYMDIAKGVLAGYQGASAAAQPSAPVAALADDRTPPPAPPPPPAPAPAKQKPPTLEEHLGITMRPVGGPNSTAPDRPSGNPDSLRVYNEIKDLPEAQLRAIAADENAAGLSRDAARLQLENLEWRRSQGLEPTVNAQGKLEYRTQEGAPKAATTTGSTGTQAAAPLPPRDSVEYDRELMSWVYDNQRRLGVQVSTDPRGWSESALKRFAPGNKGGGFEQQFLAARGGQAQAASAQPAGAGSVAGAVSVATSPDKQSLNPDDMMIARWYATVSKNSGMGEAYGLQPLSPTEMKQAEVILAKRQREQAAGAVRTWTASENQSAYDQEKASRFAGVLQRVGGDVPPELNPFLTGVMTNWADLKARTEAATIAKIESETGLNKAQAQYYVDRLRVEAVGDQLDFIARADENSRALLGDVVALVNGPFQKSMEEINKLTATDPKKAGEMFAKLVEANPVFKTAVTALNRSVSQLSDIPLRLESMPYFYGGILGFAQKQGSATVPTVSFDGQGGLGTDPRGEAAGYVFGGQ